MREEVAHAPPRLGRFAGALIMAESEGKRPQGDTPAPYCKLSRAEAARLAELGLSGMQCALYLIYASERRQVKGRPGLYCTICGDERAAEFLATGRVRALRLRTSLIATGAIACATTRDGRTPSRIFFPVQNDAMAAYLEEEGGEIPDDYVWLDNHLEDLESDGHEVSANYVGEFAGRVNFGTSDVHKNTRAKAGTPPVQESAPETCEGGHARRATDCNARRAGIGTPDVQGHSEACTGIRSDAQFGPTNDELCIHEEGKGGAAPPAGAGAHPLPSETKPEPQPPKPNAEVLAELGLKNADANNDVARIGRAYYLCPRCGHPVVRRSNTGVVRWYDCAGCGLDFLVRRGESGGFDVRNATPRLVESTDIKRTIEAFRGADDGHKA